jgi:hypothetical protein
MELDFWLSKLLGEVDVLHIERAGQPLARSSVREKVS